ncbi:hypothetical protein COHA_002870 [Chlorella ohadii]|uniref:Protein kinase domain-containing protein n=1 Tax=Chlorella ohadii TaxID=2649997 RepID=A0AAD5DWY0_9CHLO|nr:hypothetical protein COHA_002870 [Chlorella ohadii]
MVFTELPGQGILGGDYPCPHLGSVRPGMCAFTSVDQALVMCFVTTTCQAVVVYREGLDGCSSTIAVHKNVSLLPGNSFASPGVFTMLGISIPTPYGYYLYEGDGEVILPSPDELAANWAAGLGAHDGNSSTPSGWWGGIVAPNALYDGVQVAVYDGVESAEECCRVTQEWRADNRTGHPNLFNWCPLNRTEDCSYVSEDQLSGFTGVNVTLSPGQCELRWQNLVGPLQGAPPILLGKGPDVPFWCGAPLMFEPPPAPKGYRLEAGKGILLTSRFNCSGSQWDGDCTFQTSFEDGVQYCNNEQRCKEFVIKPGLPLDPLADPSDPATPYRFWFRGAVDPSLQLLVPSSALYIMQVRLSSAGTGGSGGLSTGAVVGIALGATAAAAAAAGLLCGDRPLNWAGCDLPPLPELVQHVAAQDALVAAELSGAHPTAATLMGTDALPDALREWAVDAEQIQYLRHPNGQPIEIGRGATAHVFKALYRGEVVAAKELKTGPGANSAARKAFLTEAMHLQHLRHPNVVTLYGIALTKTKGIVIMELSKLADVAFSRQKVHTFFSDTVSVVGTFAWVAPEVLLGNRQVSQACDIWSMGVVLWEIITGERPQRGQLRRPRVPEECPQAICDLMLQCLNDNPQDRPTAQQLMAQLGEGQEEQLVAEPAARPSPPPQPAAAPAVQPFAHMPAAAPAAAVPSPFAAAAGAATKASS